MCIKKIVSVGVLRFRVTHRHQCHHRSFTYFRREEASGGKASGNLVRAYIYSKLKKLGRGELVCLTAIMCTYSSIYIFRRGSGARCFVVKSFGNRASVRRGMFGAEAVLKCPCWCTDWWECECCLWDELFVVGENFCKNCNLPEICPKTCLRWF